MNAQFFDYVDQRWVEIPGRIIDISDEQARRYIPQTVRAATHYTELMSVPNQFGKNLAPGLAVLIVLERYPSG